MMKSILDFTKENFSYVEAKDDLPKGYIGWFCFKTNTYFYITNYQFKHQKDKNLIRYLDTPLKRQLCCIYLSHCKTDKEYNTLKEKINKLKIFW